MDHNKFVALVTQLESYATQSPKDYRLRLGLLAALGYAYVLFILFILIGLAVTIVIFSLKSDTYHVVLFKLLIAIAIFVGIVIESLWIKVERPVGIQVTQQNAPELLAMIEELRGKLNVPPLAQVLLVDEFNASVVQWPRFGLFGLNQNFLLLGLPLMQALNAAELRAVVAHELGHISENHGRFSVWIWRVRATWIKLTEGLQQRQHRGVILLNWFARLYSPYFMAYSFALMRIAEKKADRYVTEVADTSAAAKGLVALALYGRFLNEEYWRGVYEKVCDTSTPPEAIYFEMMKILRQPLPEDKANQWMREAVTVDARFDDTHPSLRDRLSAYGYQELLTSDDARDALLPSPSQQSAAEIYLGEDELLKLTSKFEGIWRDSISDSWEKRYEQSKQARERIRELSEISKEQELSRAEAMEIAELLNEYGRRGEALPALQAIVEKWPDYIPAKYALGCCLLNEDNETGLNLIEEAMAFDSDYILPGCEVAYEYTRIRGRNEEADVYWQRAERHSGKAEAVERELMNFTKRDRYIAHDCPVEMVAHIREWLKTEADVKEAYLVRKQLKTRPEKPAYVLGVVPQSKGMWANPDKVSSELLERLLSAKQSLPESMVIVIVDGGSAFLKGGTALVRARMRKIKGSLIYQKDMVKS